MFIVVSNTGNWDHDMWGTVGAIESANDIIPFIKKREEYPEHKIKTERTRLSLTTMADGEIRDVRVVEGKEECYELFEENEINFLCEGDPIGAIVLEREHCFPDIYFLVELK